LTPQQVVYGSGRKVWWKCEKGHEWQTQVFNRSRGVGCPVCAGRVVVVGENDLASGNPLVAAQWDYEKNDLLRPEQVSLFSNKKVWWRCSLGHQWQSKVSLRTKSGTGCPYCTGKSALPGFNDLKSQMPEIAKDWHPTLNGRMTPEMVTVGSSQRVWWQCAYGHVWKAVISSRTGKKKHGCPACGGKIKQAKKWYYEALDRDEALKNRVKKPEEMSL
jgi:DNA-directed RNA polymerase subunit RPC12/RpoP